MTEAKHYTGPERRTDQCSLCGEEQLKSCINAKNIEKIQEQCKDCAEKFVKDVNNRIPMWGLIPMLSVLIGIFLIQWATYEKVSLWVNTANDRITRLEERQLKMQETVVEHVQKGGNNEKH